MLFKDQRNITAERNKSKYKLLGIKPSNKEKCKILI